MSGLESAYLALVIGAVLAFVLVIAWIDLSAWRHSAANKGKEKETGTGPASRMDPAPTEVRF